MIVLTTPFLSTALRVLVVMFNQMSPTRGFVGSVVTFGAVKRLERSNKSNLCSNALNFSYNDGGKLA